MRCFFLKLTNTLKQSDLLHFFTSGLHYFVEVTHLISSNQSQLERSGNLAESGATSNQ